jgi:hypothetical protein
VGAQQHPDLGAPGDYPEAAEVWLGALVGEVAVNPEFPIEVNTPGDLQWRVGDGAQVAEDQVIGLIGARKLELSEREVQLKRNRYRNAAADIEQTNLDQKKTLQNSIRELEQKLSRMSLTKTELELLGSEFAQRLAKERTELDEELQRSRARLESDYFEQAETADRHALDLELEHAEVDHEELRRNSEVLAPTAGRIKIEWRDEIRGATVIGKIIKEGLAEVRLEMADVRLQSIPGAELVIEISGDDGRIHRGGYLRTLEERSLARNARILVFGVDQPDGAGQVPASLAGSRMIRLYRKLARPGRIVPKSDLIFRFPQEISAAGWAGFIEKRWPGIKVTYVAPKVVVVNPAHEN